MRKVEDRMDLQFTRYFMSNNTRPLDFYAENETKKKEAKQKICNNDDETDTRLEKREER